MDNATCARMIEELYDLHYRSSKLYDFMDTEGFSKLPQPCQDDLEAQFVHMGDYAEVLSRRIAWAFGNIAVD